ncbi:MAG: glycine--tRNA ligase subunit beta [Rhodospirillales bacterium]|nr:glycine--tRNA ligase subunit beta [Rhodospirillales bacterium]
MPELLLEILSEEIPARMQARAAEDLRRLVTGGLEEAGLAFDSARAFATPRRLALVVDGLPAKTPDISEERRGPRADAPDRAVEGFLRGNGITRDQAEIRETGKGSFYFAVIEKKGAKSVDLLPEILAEAIDALPWPKSMRWAGRSERWVRPIHGLLCLLDGRKVSLARGGIESGSKTVGHRFLAPKAFAVKGFDDYEAKLRNAKVILDAAERREIILADAVKLADEAGLRLKDDPGLADEVAGLVEWPVTYMGTIDGEFMDLPPEVLTTSMRAHQKYFALETTSGALAPNFIVVANTETSDKGKAVVAGNERVLRARLADAKFYWDQDRRASLQSYKPFLENLVFHADAGTVAVKIFRMENLVDVLLNSFSPEFIKGTYSEDYREAVRLAKCDLASGMVREFPELQGLMGRYYALEDKVNPSVATAIAEHYSPKGPRDSCPTKPISVFVSLLDKLHDLGALYAVGVRATGSGDPYGLRRTALGIIRLILENSLRVPLQRLLYLIVRQYNPTDTIEDDEAIVDEILDFIADRLKVHLREQGTRHDLISAVFALGGEDDLVRLTKRVSALGRFLETDDGASLLTVYKRAANILRAEEKRDNTKYSDEGTNPLTSRESAEQDLIDRLWDVGPKITKANENEEFDESMRLLSSTRPDLDKFFDNVTVNVEDSELRETRLRMLDFIRKSFHYIADFSQIEGGER